MSIYKNLISLCAAVVFALGLAACSSGTDAPAEPEVTMPEPEPTPDPGPTDLEETQMAAAAAAAAAKTASDNAAASADMAEADTENVATIQTGADLDDDAMGARESAMAARDAANAAMAAYMDAKAGSEAAEAATTGAEAEAGWRMAVDGQEDAEAAEAMAAEHATAAAEAAMMEVMVDGTMKSIGDGDDKITITVDGIERSHTDDAGQTTLTGLQRAVNQANAAVTGLHAVGTAGDPGAVAYRQARAARNAKIGTVHDSSDDTARLMLITHYVDLVGVKVFADADAGDASDNLVVRTNNDGTDGTNRAADGAIASANLVADQSAPVLTPVGMFIEATTVAGATGAVDNALDSTDQVGTTAKAQQVYSYTGDTGAEYVVVRSTLTDSLGSTVTYQHVDITADLDGDGAGTVEEGRTAAIPTRMAYKHLHFGAWAGLGAATKSGAQKVTDLGIGFVAALPEEEDGAMGMTGDDMPNTGSAVYNGNWVANVRANAGDGGGISQQSGTASLAASFTLNTVTATLTGLATLVGTIDEDTFSGTRLTSTGDAGGLDGGVAHYTGSWSGGFFGEKAAEAGGVFDYTSRNMRYGEFRGAFGGTKQ